MTREVKEYIAEKGRRIMNYTRHKRRQDLDEANRLSGIINKMRKNMKKGQVDEAYRDFTNGHQKFWKMIAELIKPDKVNQTADFIHHLTGEKVHNDKAADYFNEFFATVGEKMCTNMNFDIQAHPDLTYEVRMECPPIEIVEDMIRKLVNGIKTSKSSGIDGINARVLKDALSVLIPQMVDLFKKSIEHGIFPDKWAVSTVVPIPKSGSLNEIGNWRPINLLPIPGRLLEKIVHEQILSHLQTNELLHPAQYGFRPGLGTGDAIFDFINHIYGELDKGNFVSTCFVDGSKVFDSVHHKLLLKKCKAIKLHNNIIKWLESYLSNRRQVTTLNSVKSKQCRVTFGVPQGSSLGPLMFLLFINDFPRVVNHSKVFMYADDIVLVSSGRSFVESEQKLALDVDSTNIWCKSNCLTVNKKKTKVMRVTRQSLLR